MTTTPSPDAERAPVDLDEHERDVRGFTGTFLYLDRFIDECETNYYDAIILAPDGIAEDDCPVIAHDIDDDVAELLRRQPAATVVVVPDAGHSVQGDDPLRLAELIEGVLSPGG